MRQLTFAVIFSAAIAAPLVAAPAKPAAVRTAARDWSAMVSATPQGGILLGNPAARVKLVEFGSLSCSHCRDFHGQAMPVLKAKYLKSGRLSYEFRSFVRNGADLGASLVLQCQTPRAAWAMADRFFAGQDQWLLPFTKLTAEDTAKINGASEDEKALKMAALGKLPEHVATLGVPRARYDACVADKPATQRLLAIRNDAITNWGLEGTPTFVLAGKTVPNIFTWSELEPRIVAALAARP
ncbi:thioredoxin domain-containing protein [Sandarakinorhabdus sp.]|uniref:thioredoxin domain-containing protein n=1 Tax=Sandarakinorhabdus sp. TaxID=1916663 RepID=UPI00286DF5A0|nr:thioredoxin domain-containing protein [Sandarakinorhabdus sp.]